VPAVCGSLIIPTTYHLMLELGLTQWTAALAGFLLLCGMYVCMYMRGNIIMMMSFIRQVVILHLGLKTVIGTRIQRKVEESKIGWD
jgi:dolichyl-phosphate-mannose-protein mannosyltransferase